MSKKECHLHCPLAGLFLLSLLFFFLTAPSFAHSQTSSSFYTYMERCEDLRPEIEQILQDEGLPPYFFYLALAESGCDPDNKSSRNALGLFQLVPYTFKAYSKGVCNTEDELGNGICPEESAFDPLVSTRVAAKYLKSLYDRFQDLDWTIAAFNAGGTNLMRKTSYYKGMDIKVVKKYFPQAYDLAMKVRHFSELGKALEKENS